MNYLCCCFPSKNQQYVTKPELNTQKLLKFNLEGQEINVLVKSVYDGDTIHVIVPIELNIYSFETTSLFIKQTENNGIKFYDITVRLDGIDTPELKPKLNSPNRDIEIKKANDAKKYLSTLIENKIVKIKFLKNEKFGRHLGIIYYNDENINQKMIDLNYAVPYFGGKKNNVV